MYKILLCDDEKIVLDSLNYIIQKNFVNECSIEFAKTGRDLIELSETFRPDIAIVDIQMPGINGIEAMKEIVKTNQSIQFIVLTAFDKFEYAKESANLGVLKFLNKPVNQNVVADTIRFAMNKIKKEREKRSYDLEIKEKLESIVPVIENGFIYSLLLESDSHSETSQYKNLLAIKAEYGYMMIIEWGELREGYHLSNAIGASIKAQSFYGEIREYIKEFFNAYIGAVVTNKITVYVPAREEQADYNMRISIIENARALVRKLMKRIDYDFRIGVGSIKNLTEASESYNEAIKALKYGKGKVVHVEDVVAPELYEGDYPWQKEKALFENMKRGNVSKAKELANEIAEWMVENYSGTMQKMKLKIIEFIVLAEKLALQQERIVYSDDNNYLEIVLQMNSVEQLQKWFLSKIEEISRSIASKETQQTNETIRKATEYINEHFKKNLSLDDVSRVVNVSPYYFSKIFKEETGKNFIDYLTQLRIDEAKYLLEQKEYSIKEVCIEVGYSDPNYFSRLFKKQEGLTPTEFREK